MLFRKLKHVCSCLIEVFYSDGIGPLKATPTSLQLLLLLLLLVCFRTKKGQVRKKAKKGRGRISFFLSKLPIKSVSFCLNVKLIQLEFVLFSCGLLAWLENNNSLGFELSPSNQANKFQMSNFAFPVLPLMIYAADRESWQARPRSF